MKVCFDTMSQKVYDAEIIESKYESYCPGYYKNRYERPRTEPGTEIRHVSFRYPDEYTVKISGVVFGVGSIIFNWANSDFIEAIEADPDENYTTFRTKTVEETIRKQEKFTMK